MMQVGLHPFPAGEVEYKFQCRNAGAPGIADLSPYVNEIREEVRSLCSLHFQYAELAYLKAMRFIKSDFVDFLRIFQFQRDFIEVRDNQGTLEIVARGPQVHVMAFEIHVLAIVNEPYFRRFDQTAALAGGRRRLAGQVRVGRAPVGNPAPT